MFCNVASPGELGGEPREGGCWGSAGPAQLQAFKEREIHKQNDGFRSFPRSAWERRQGRSAFRFWKVTQSVTGCIPTQSGHDQTRDQGKVKKPPNWRFFGFALGKSNPTKQQPPDYAPTPSPDTGLYPHRSSSCEDPYYRPPSTRRRGWLICRGQARSSSPQSYR